MASDLGDKIAAAALSCIGTPFHHGGRAKGVALDCVGLLVVCGRECGLDIADQPFYPPQDDNFDRLVPALERHCRKVPNAMRPGDIVLFRRTGCARPIFNHVGVVTCRGFVHAWGTPSVMQVVETPFDRYWHGAVCGTYRWRES